MLPKKILTKAVVITLIFLMFLSGCSSPIPPKNRQVLSGFSVHFIDVGQGDCIYVHLPDGKNVLIDCGYKNDENFDTVTEFLFTYGVTKIDYFILTHPDLDHVGNAESLIDAYNIGTLYHPHIVESSLDLFPTYKSAFNKAKDKAEKLNVSDCYDLIKGDDYFIAFLTPLPKVFSDGVYTEFNQSTAPGDTLINNLSPIIYLEYKGVSFLFTGDAGVKQEKLAIETVNATWYKNHLLSFGVSFDINNVDYLKVAHHGANDCTGKEFLQTVNPKTAILSVGGDNPYGHPSSELLARIIENNADCKIMRTDVYGTISIGVENNGVVKTVTDAK
jgi:competence protein ComEC